MEGAKMFMEWLKFHNDKDLLPTTLPLVRHDASLRRRSAGDIVNWIRSSISSASDTLEEEAVELTETSPSFDEATLTLSESDGPYLRGALTSTVVGPVSFPAFLNNGHATPMRFDYRRASLLDGMEKTVENVSFTQGTVLTLPLKGTKNKLNKAIKNLLSPSVQKPSLSLHQPIRDEELAEQSLLPVPIYDLPQLTTNGQKREEFLSLTEVKKNLDGDETTGTYPSQSSTVVSVVGLLAIFLGACAMIGVVYNNFPELSEEDRSKVTLPKDIEDAKELGRVLSKYKNTYHYEVMSAFFVTFIFLQTFAIPGSVFLSILSGFMYPFYIALFLVCMCSGIGATGCYAISYFIGKPLVHRYLAERVSKWNEVVDGQREHLFNYLLFLRITPFLPNWFINIVSPVIKIPVSTFFIATFVGVAPLSFIAIQAGTTLYQLTTAGDAFSWTGIGVMAILAVLSLVPVLLKNKLKGKYE